MPHRNPEATACTALRPSGKFCDGKSLPDAPFPICVTCAAKVLRYLQSYMPQSFEDRLLVGVRAVEHNRTEADRLPGRDLGNEVVYYLRVGENIKIGYSSHLSQRLRTYPPDSVLLATEPGSLALEAQRHGQFKADLRHGNEWFAPSPRLMAHIADLRVKYPLDEAKPPKRSPRKWAKDNAGRDILI